MEYRKEVTSYDLQAVFAEAKQIGGKTQSKKLKTKSGVKDTYQDYFLDKIYNFTKDLRSKGTETKKQLNEFLAELPEQLTNLIWCLKGELRTNATTFTHDQICKQALILILIHHWRYYTAVSSDISNISGETQSIIECQMSPNRY